MGVRRFFVPVLVLAVFCGICHGQSTYGFSEGSYNGYEGERRVRVTIERDGSTASAGQVRVSTFASSASAGGDYISINSIIDFAANVERVTVDIDLINDDIANEDESFIVRLSDPTGGTIGRSETVVNIKDGSAPSSALDTEVIIAIAVAAAAAVLILLVCCCLIYCLRFRDGGEREEVVYVKRPEREPEPYPEYPESYPDITFPREPPRSYTPPPRRPYTPPLRPRTPPPARIENPSTQVMVINEPSPPIVEPPPPKPTQVIVIRPQTPEIIRRRPEEAGTTEVIINRPRPRSASPSYGDRDRPSRFDDDDRDYKRSCRKPEAVRGDRHRSRDRSRYRREPSLNGFGNGTGMFGPTAFGQSSLGFGNSAFSSPFGPTAMSGGGFGQSGFVAYPTGFTNGGFQMGPMGPSTQGVLGPMGPSTQGVFGPQLPPNWPNTGRRF